ncbi:MAG: WD40 repeat domain-containing protein [Bacteroidales bacterium]|jgi:WD40 repeat protein|nr:WD40 repeat domain-containing protein [Bacteroidales bacterium]
MKKSISSICILLLGFSLFSQSIDYITQTLSYKSPVTAVDVSPDEQWILAGFENGSLLILDAQNYEEKLMIEEASSSAIYDIEMSPKMDVIFIATGNRIMLYDTTGNHIINWAHHKNTIWSMDINKTGEYIVSTEVNKTFQLSNVYEGRIEQSMRGHDDVTLAVAFSPDGKKIASGSNDRKVFLWDLETREKIAEFQGHSDNIYDLAFSPDGKLLASCSKDNSVRIWNIEENKLLHLLKGHREMVLEIEFSPNGKYLISASADQAIKLWDVASGEQLYAYLESEASIADIEFLPDGKSFISAGMEGKLRAWEIHPEIFVLKYFSDEYEKELKDNPIFLPRQKGEKKSDYEVRMENAFKLKEEIIANYYQLYLDKE